MGSWEGRAACYQHEALPPDAWERIESGRPVHEGLHALAVCQRVCPVSLECRNWLMSTHPVEIIGGGGWWDRRGKFRLLPVESMTGLNPYRKAVPSHRKKRPTPAEEHHELVA